MTAAPAKNQTIKLQTNIPLIGVVKYMDYWPAKVKDGVQMGAQVSLKGTWDEKGDGVVYLPLPVGTKLLEDGFARRDGERAFQGATVPQYRWDFQGRVKVLKHEIGVKKFTTVTSVDEGDKDGSPPIQRAEPEGEETADTKAVRKRWADMQETYECCVKIAMKAWGREPEFAELTDALAAAAATLFIEANKRNLPPPPKREAQQ